MMSIANGDEPTKRGEKNQRLSKQVVMMAKS